MAWHGPFKFSRNLPCHAGAIFLLFTRIRIRIKSVNSAKFQKKEYIKPFQDKFLAFYGQNKKLRVEWRRI